MKVGVGGGVEWYGPLQEVIVCECAAGLVRFLLVQDAEIWAIGDLDLVLVGVVFGFSTCFWGFGGESGAG